MTIKKSKMLLGKQIRKQTGLPLPLAMRAAKKLYARKHYELFNDSRFAGFISSRAICPDGPGCCGSVHYFVGKRGEYLFSY